MKTGVNNRLILCWRWLPVVALLLTACSTQPRAPRPHAPYVPLTEIETYFGSLVTAGNHPTGDQMGTGDRLGLFRDSGGTIWGLPLTIGDNGNVLVCAPNTLRDAPVTDQ